MFLDFRLLLLLQMETLPVAYVRVLHIVVVLRVCLTVWFCLRNCVCIVLLVCWYICLSLRSCMCVCSCGCGKRTLKLPILFRVSCRMFACMRVSMCVCVCVFD